MLIKLDYLPCDQKTLKYDLQDMEREITKYTEWTMFDDNILESKGSWADILEHCTQNRVYPTVILYERLDPGE